MISKQEIDLVVSVIRDGQRIDRNLFRAEDGHLYTSPDSRFMTADGVETPTHVEIPVGYRMTKAEEEELAWALIEQLDDAIDRQ